jgi:hypothetical protein
MRKLYALLCIALALFLCLASCTPPNGESASKTDILVAVNGLEFTRTLPSMLVSQFGTSLNFEGDREDYLKPALASHLGSQYDIRTFDWDGDATKTDRVLAAEGPSSLRAYLRAAYEEAREKGVKFVVVSHSWGTFLCYLALAMESGGADPIDCDLFITLSCPIAANHAGTALDPLDAAVEAYANAWMSDSRVDFDINAFYPKAERFLNYWAFGDCVSGPLATRIPPAAGVKDIQVDFFKIDGDGAIDQYMAELKRGTDDVVFWHDFTSLKDSVATDKAAYGASEGFSEAETRELIYSFHAEVAGEILKASSNPPSPLSAPKLHLSLDSIECINNPERTWLYNFKSEYYGFFRIKSGKELFSARKWFENGLAGGLADQVCAWMDQGDSRSVGWTREVPAALGLPTTISLEAVFYEDDIGGDASPGTGSVSFDFNGSAWVLPVASGSFDCSWNDSDGENRMRVHWSARLAEAP